MLSWEHARSPPRMEGGGLQVTGASVRYRNGDDAKVASRSRPPRAPLQV